MGLPARRYIALEGAVSIRVAKCADTQSVKEAVFTTW